MRYATDITFWWFSGHFKVENRKNYYSAAKLFSTFYVQYVFLQYIPSFIRSCKKPDFVDINRFSFFWDLLSLFQLLKKGVDLESEVDSELIAKLLAWSSANHSSRDSDWIDWIDLMVTELNTTSYSLAIMVKDRIFAVRDPWGNRPLCIGELSE